MRGILRTTGGTRRTAVGVLTALAVTTLGAAVVCAQTASTSTDRRPAQPAQIDGPQIIIPNVQRRVIGVHREHSPLELTKVDAAVTIRGQAASTTLTLTLHNPAGRQQEAVLLVPVPHGAVVKGLNYDTGGPEPVAELLRADEARRYYDSIVSSLKDPALVEFAGWNLIKTSVFPVPAGKTAQVGVEYEQVLPLESGRIDYVLPRGEALAAGGAAWTITTHITGDVDAAFSTSHDIVTKRTRSGLQIESIKENEARGAFRLSLIPATVAGDELRATVLTAPDPTDPNAGYFMLLATAADQKLRQPRQREVVLVLDRSGSMRGEKIVQAVNAARQIVSGLREGEYFNIIDYSDSIQSYADKPVEVTKDEVAKALSYLSSIQANGGTNIRDALLEAVRPDPTGEALPLVLFLTDGLPTVGERNEVRIRESVNAANDDNRRIFTFGVGSDVNVPLLSALSTASRGATSIVTPGEDVETAVSRVFARLDGPVLLEPELTSTGGMRLVDIAPAVLPDMFKGEQLVVFGRYKTGEEKDVTAQIKLTGTAGDQELAAMVTLDPATASESHSYIRRLWAGRRIAVLGDQIRQAQADGSMSEDSMKEIIDEIVRLSLEHGVLTEYTAFLARESTDMSDGLAGIAPAAEPAAREVLRSRAGEAAAGQQMDMNMKNAQVAATNTASYYGRGMSEERVSVVQNIAGRGYFKRDDRWVQGEVLAKKEREPDRTVEFGTEAYTKLVEALTKLGRQAELAQGGDILMLVEKELILVKAAKDEKAQEKDAKESPRK